MDVLRLKNNYDISIEDGASLDSMVHKAATEAEALAVCKELTAENVESVTFLHDGQVTGIFSGLVFANPVRREIVDDGVLVLISLREKTAVEAEIEALKAEQEIQNEAIDFLAMM